MAPLLPSRGGQRAEDGGVRGHASTLDTPALLRSSGGDASKRAGSRRKFRCRQNERATSVGDRTSCSGRQTKEQTPDSVWQEARMNSRQRQRHRRVERQADAKTNPSVKNARGRNIFNIEPHVEIYLGPWATLRQKNKKGAREHPGARRVEVSFVSGVSRRGSRPSTAPASG